MIPPIQPRVIHFLDKNGVVGEIKIAIDPLPDTMVEFANESSLKVLNAEVIVESDPLTHTMKVQAFDEIQLIYCLLWCADVYIQTRFAQAGYQIFKIRPGDVDGPMDIYN